MQLNTGTILLDSRNKAELSALPLFLNENINVSPLTGGLHCDVYKVETNQGIYVAKRHIKNSNLLNEVVGQNLASNAGLAADIIYQNNNWLISDYLAGKLLADCASSIVQKAELILSASARLHQLNNTQKLTKLDGEMVLINLFSESIQQSPEAKQYQAIISRAIQLSNELKQQADKPVFVHGDLNFANAIVLTKQDKSHQQIRLIDFEACSLSSMEYELAMMFSVNLIPIELHQHLINFYTDSNHHSVCFKHEKVTRNLVVAAVINGLWYLGQYQTNANQIYFQKALAQLDYAELASKQL